MTKTTPAGSTEFAEHIDKVGTFILANLLWLLFALPLITLPAATAGLFTAIAPLTRSQPTRVFQDFFQGMRQHWQKATLIGLLDVLVGALVIVNVLIFQRMDIAQPIVLLSQSMTLFVAVSAVMVNLYLWPLLVAFDDLTVRRLLATALRLVFAYPLWSLVILVLALLPPALTIILPGAYVILALFSSVALIANWGAWRVIRQHLSE
jgi:uncharacterized membrane protein YesL